MVIKEITELTVADYEKYPIWTWIEDDSSMVEPINQDFLPEDHDALFIYCQLELDDGTRTSGVISVRVSDREVYVIRFIDQNNKIFRFPLQEMLRTDSNIVQLTEFLGKGFNDIFPLKYRTPYKFRDGQKLEGVVIY